jgi:SAM-dependent methyltransferase
MTTLRRLENAHERMDQPRHDHSMLDADLRHIESVNRYLGGHRAVRSALTGLLEGSSARSILDVGCGGGDIPRMIAKHAAERRLAVHIIAADRHDQIVRIARSRSVGQPGSANMQFTRCNALALPFADRSVDIALMSLTLHHFDGEVRLAVLRELARVARLAVIINELERCWPNYLGARFLAATVWRGNTLSRHDGPVSVLRAFTPAELRVDLRAAGLHDVRVERRFFYRLIGVGTPVSAKRAALATV